MPRKLIVLNSILIVMLALSLAYSQIQAGTPVRADAVVLVNFASPAYQDFEHYTQPYLDHFGVPYSMLDISTTPITTGVGDYALIIVGHRQLDPTSALLDDGEEGYLSTAVNDGTGLVNFDNDLSSGGVGRYAFIQEVFGFGYGGATSGSGVSFPAGIPHYITERHDPASSISTGSMTLPGVTLPAAVSSVATTGTQPFLAVTTYGAGRAVQWGSYQWMSHAVKGPVYGLDDLVWRSLVWAAHKPFVMQGMPPFLTMRVDDESGNFEWIHIANEFGIKPWAGLFINNIDAAESADLSALINAGLATAAIHAYDGSFFYFNHGSGDYPDATIAANFTTGTAWHADRNIPISDYVLPHYYEFGSNVFQGLSDWGVEFVGTQMDPGYGYGAAWIMNGPFRKYETGGSGAGVPQYYADFMTIPGHPEFNRSGTFPGFFNCVTEIRDDAGYEWYPNLGDVAGTIGHGTRQTKRALDGMELATLFTHGYYISGSWNASAPANWRAILQGIMDNLSAYEPEPVTMDYACRYIRATTTSNIAGAYFDTATNQVTANFSGATDIPTRFYLFMDGEGYVMVDVPAFSGTAAVNYTIPGPLHHIAVSPNPATVVAGTTQQFSAVGYDVDNNPIPNLTFAWSVVDGGGTIDASGRFTAGVTPGTYTGTVVAMRNGISGTASVTVTEPVLHHFEFAPITSPKYLDAPFSITIRARDDAGNLVVGYAGSVTLSDSTGTVSPTTVGPFAGGAWTGQATIGAAAGSVILTATGSGVSGTSNAFQVLTAPTCPCSLWDSGTAPSNPFNADPSPVELGVKFRSATDGFITALRFYRGASNTGTTFTGHLWTADGTLLAEATYPTGTPAGWQQVSLPAPIAISADTTYIVSYHTTVGYAVNRPYFTEGNRSLFERPPLRALVDGEQGGNGVYMYGPSGSFPNNTYESSNYWADVVFVTDLTPPEVCVGEDCSLWDDSFTPTEPANVDPQTQAQGVELGVRFKPSLDGYLTGLRYYRGSGNTTEHPGHLWASDGTLLATLTFPAGTTTGWQQALFDTPVPVLANQIYVASYHTSTNWARTLDYFTTGRSNPPLYAFSSTEPGGPNGLYHYGTPSAFPDGSYRATNYWVDVLFRTQIQSDNTAPSVASTTPAPDAVDVDPSAEVTVTFSEAVNPDTISGSTFELFDPSNELVAASVTYDQLTRTARLNPDSSLAYLTTYRAVVTGGVYGVMDLAGNSMYGNYNWSFTTAAAPPTLDHFTIAAISSPQTAGVPFPITVTAYDTNGNVFIDYTGPASLSASAGTLSPLQTGAFTNGVWTGSVTIDTDAALIGVTIAASDGAVTGQSNSFDVQLPPPAPPFYTVTSDSYDQLEDVPFQVTVTAYSGTTIDLWEDSHQSPIRPTFTDPSLLNDHDGQWDEFWYTLNRPLPALFAGHNEWENNSLQPMHFFATNIPNGQYEVYASLYTPYPTRYYYGYTEAEALANARYVDNVVGAGGTLQFAEHLLGTLDINNGRFDLWAGDGDSSANYYYGWIWIRLAPVTSGQQIDLWEDTHQDPILVTTTDPAQLVEIDGKWTEFSYPISRPFPGVFAAVNEETYGLPVMHFFASGLGNGTYEVFANLYDNSPLRYYYGYTAADPKALSVDLPGCFTGTQFREYSLGTVTITDGNFDLYVRDADIRTGTSCGITYPFFGWAWIRLVPHGLTMSSSSSTLLFDGDGDGIFGEPSDEVKQLVGGTFDIMARDTTPGTGVIIRADDTDGRFGFNTYNILETNDPPVLDPIGNKTVDEEIELTFSATATDPDLPGDTLTFSLVGEPAGASIDPATGAFAWTPTEAQGAGTFSFGVCVSDGALDDCETIEVTVSEVNVAPVLEPIGDKSINEEALLSFTAAASDHDFPVQALTFNLVGAPEGATIDPATAAFTWMPSEAQGPITYIFEVCVSDGVADPVCETFTVTVNEVNLAPVLEPIGDKSINEETLLGFTATASDHDIPAQTLAFSLMSAPEGASIDPSTGAFAWTPTETQGPITYIFDVCVSDSALSDCETITVTVSEVNIAPVLDPIGDKTVDEETELSFAATATDPDLPANTLIFSLVGAPAGATIDQVTGAFSWTPTEAQGPGPYPIDVCVSDSALSDCETITVTVSEVNRFPVLGAIGNQSVDEMTELAFIATASDPDLPANTLTFSLVDGPTGASIDPSTGAFAWTPSEDQGPASYAFTVKVCDNGTPLLCDEEEITITVNEVNRYPVLGAIGNQSVDEMTELAFIATATDPDEPANTLTFSLVDGPTGASIDPSTGAFAWTSSEDQGPASYTFTVKVCDDGTPSLCDDETITVTVNEVNRYPVLGAIGNKSLMWGNELSFTATATDPDIPANTLTFSLVSAPEGANITSGGDFTWTPASTQIGLHTFTVKVCDDSSPVLCDQEEITVTVGKRATLLVYSGDASGQYSDTVTVKATLTDNGGGLLQGSAIGSKLVTFTVGSQSASSTTETTGLAQTTITLNQATGTPGVNSSFAGDDLYLSSSDSDSFKINLEDATIEFDEDNPVAVKVATAGGSSGPFNLVVLVKELQPDVPTDQAAAGDINQAEVSVTLEPVGPGSPIAGTCSSNVVGSGYDAILYVTCPFSGVVVNTYTVQVTVNGDYYTGSGEDVLVVYDPSLGFTTAGGWFYWPGTNDRTNFGYTMKYNKKGANVQGSLLLIRHLADGTDLIYRVKSNALYGLALSPTTNAFGWASFSGKSTYLEPSWAEPKGNYEFIVYVEDRDDPGTGTDRFWINVIEGISMGEPATEMAIPIQGGNIVVPHSTRPSR